LNPRYLRYFVCTVTRPLPFSRKIYSVIHHIGTPTTLLAEGYITSAIRQYQYFNHLHLIKVQDRQRYLCGISLQRDSEYPCDLRYHINAPFIWG